MAGNYIFKLYKNLINEYGDPISYWPQWCLKNKTSVEREKIIVGMILVQHTTWHNANIALKKLRDANLLSISKIAALKELPLLTELIKSAGFFRSKPKRLFDICTFIESQGGVDKLLNKKTSDVRWELLKINGIGKETADTILLYALDKPVFIIDEYTYRWVDKNNIFHTNNYDQLQAYFHEKLKPDVELYRNFHTLIIVSQRGRDKSKMEVV